MQFARRAAAAAVVCLGLGVVGSSAVMAEPASLMGCLSMAKKASAALDAGQQSPGYAEARSEASVARDYCTRQMYREGVAHYERVLKLLGTG